MSSLHVAIGRKLGWPVSLASVHSHTVCRFDNGEVTHNLEATDTGRGGFAIGSDKEYAEKFDLSQRALDRSMELKSMTAREMLGYFISLRGRHYADIRQMGKADRDYALARSIIPNHRRTYMAAVQAAVGKGHWLFSPGEVGHPISLAQAIDAKFGGQLVSAPSRPVHSVDVDPLHYVKKKQIEEAAKMRQTQQANEASWRNPGLPQSPFNDPRSAHYQHPRTLWSATAVIQRNLR